MSLEPSLPCQPQRPSQGVPARRGTRPPRHGESWVRSVSIFGSLAVCAGAYMYTRSRRAGTRRPSSLTTKRWGFGHGQPRRAQEQEPEEKEKMQVKEGSIYALLLVSCFSLLGFTMPSPALPEIRNRFTLPDWETGLVGSSMSLGMLAAVWYWPTRSDAWGRIKVLKWSMFVTALLFFVQAWFLGKEWFRGFLFMRLVTGCFAGCNPIFKAYLADVVPASKLARFMVWREASATFAFIVGPFLGGLMTASQFGIAGPFLATFVAHLLGAAICWTCVEESPARTSDVEVKEPMQPDDSAKKWPLLVNQVFVMSFFYVVSQTCFSFFTPLLLHDRFGFETRTIGVFLTSTAGFVLFCQLFLYKALFRRLGLVWTGALGALAILLGLLFMGLGSLQQPPIKIMMLMIGGACYAFGSATFPTTVPTLLAKFVTKEQRGKVLGRDSLINNIGRVITPLCLASLYGMNPFLCFGAGSCASLVVVFMLLNNRTEMEK